jgi:hypothetical protein
MTSHTTMTMPQTQRRTPDTQLAGDFTPPLPQLADRSVHALHIVVSRSKFARATSTQGHNVRLAIWLAGWHIAIYQISLSNPQLHNNNRRLAGDHY